MTLTDDVLMELETKANAALENLPPAVRIQRWRVATCERAVTLIGLEVPDPGDSRFPGPESGYPVVPCTPVTERPEAEHMAAADPLAVLALVAEVRALREKVKTEGNAALDAAAQYLDGYASNYPDVTWSMALNEAADLVRARKATP